MNLKSTLLPLSLIACAAFSSLSHADADIIESIPLLDGDVNSSWAVDVFSDELTIGSAGVFFPNVHKAFVTFDTTQIDSSRDVASAIVRLTMAQVPAEIELYDLTEYINDNIKVEVAGPFGFGGSFSIAASDLYAVPQTILPRDKYQFSGIAGGILIDLTDYVYLYGKTQVAISFASNPLNIAINFNSGDFAFGEDCSSNYPCGAKLHMSYYNP